MNIQEIRRINATKHGGYGTPLYGVWNTMRQRCSNPSVKEYKYYGAKNISVCDEWNDFSNFQKWAIANGYCNGLTLDRIDCLKGYSPCNCRWVTNSEQQRNKTTNVILPYRGEKRCAKEWSEVLGINYKTLMNRLYRGWSVERASLTPTETTFGKMSSPRYRFQVQTQRTVVSTSTSVSVLRPWNSPPSELVMLVCIVRLVYSTVTIWSPALRSLCQRSGLISCGKPTPLTFVSVKLETTAKSFILPLDGLSMT